MGDVPCVIPSKFYLGRRPERLVPPDFNTQVAHGGGAGDSQSRLAAKHFIIFFKNLISNFMGSLVREDRIAKC